MRNLLIFIVLSIVSLSSVTQDNLSRVRTFNDLFLQLYYNDSAYVKQIDPQKTVDKCKLNLKYRIESDIQNFLDFNINDTIYVVTKYMLHDWHWEVIWNSSSIKGYLVYDSDSNDEIYDTISTNLYMPINLRKILMNWGKIKTFESKFNTQNLLHCDCLEIQRIILEDGLIKSVDRLFSNSCILDIINDIYIEEHDTGVIDLTKQR